MNQKLSAFMEPCTSRFWLKCDQKVKGKKQQNTHEKDKDTPKKDGRFTQILLNRHVCINFEEAPYWAFAERILTSSQSERHEGLQ